MTTSQLTAARRRQAIIGLAFVLLAGRTRVAAGGLPCGSRARGRLARRDFTGGRERRARPLGGPVLVVRLGARPTLVRSFSYFRTAAPGHPAGVRAHQLGALTQRDQ